MEYHVTLRFDLPEGESGVREITFRVDSTDADNALHRAECMLRELWVAPHHEPPMPIALIVTVTDE